MVAKRLLLVTCLAAFGACTLDKQSAPALGGPSTLGLSIDLKASPDTLFRDGVSTSVIDATAFDADGKPVAGLPIRFASQISLGALSATMVSTDASGKASVTYTAPNDGSETTTTLSITPVGENYQNAHTRTITIRLIRP